MNAVQEQPVRPNAMVEEREFIAPEVNIFETNDGYVLEADMPGVCKDCLDVTVEGNTLTIEGRREEGKELNAELLYRESPRADFRRVFELDPTIDAGRISARIDQGVVTVTLPKAEKVKPRKISVE